MRWIGGSLSFQIHLGRVLRLKRSHDMVSTRSGGRKRNVSAALEESSSTDLGAARIPKTENTQTNVKVEANGGQSFFLMKSEGESRIVNGQDVKFSIDDLSAMPDQTSYWDGVRNYQARNIMKEMRVGDMCFFYHSNCKPPGVVGVVTVTKEAYPDHTQFDPKSNYYDSKSSREDPRWILVDVKLARKMKRLISLDELKGHKSSALKNMMLLNNSRLSVQRVTSEEWKFIEGLEDADTEVHEEQTKNARKTKRSNANAKAKAKDDQ